MKIKTAIATLALALAPSIALAMGCSSDHRMQEAMSCAEGSVWDAEAGTCVEQVTS